MPLHYHRLQPMTKANRWTQIPQPTGNHPGWGATNYKKSENSLSYSVFVVIIISSNMHYTTTVSNLPGPPSLMPCLRPRKLCSRLLEIWNLEEHSSFILVTSVQRDSVRFFCPTSAKSEVPLPFKKSQSLTTLSATLKLLKAPKQAASALSDWRGDRLISLVTLKNECLRPPPNPQAQFVHLTTTHSLCKHPLRGVPTC